jgi:hypothetical protein
MEIRLTMSQLQHVPKENLAEEKSEKDKGIKKDQKTKKKEDNPNWTKILVKTDVLARFRIVLKPFLASRVSKSK